MPNITIHHVDGMYETHMIVHTMCGKSISGESGYLRSLLTIAANQFGHLPAVEGLRVEIADIRDALVTGVFVNGVKLRDRRADQLRGEYPPTGKHV